MGLGHIDTIVSDCTTASPFPPNMNRVALLADSVTHLGVDIEPPRPKEKLENSDASSTLWKCASCGY